MIPSEWLSKNVKKLYADLTLSAMSAEESTQALNRAIGNGERWVVVHPEYSQALKKALHCKPRVRDSKRNKKYNLIHANKRRNKYRGL